MFGRSFMGVLLERGFIEMAERAEFEKVMVRLGYAPAWDGNGYLYEEVQVAWQAWQAARSQSPDHIADSSKMVARERGAFELLRSLRGDYYCGCGHPKCSKEATQREIDEVLAAQPEQPGEVTALTSDLSARINRVSRRSLDGSVVMSSEEWNGIVELVEKLLTVAHPHNGEQGGEWVSVDERQPDEFGEYLAATVARPHGWVIRYAPVGWICSEDYPVTHWMPLPQPPTAREPSHD